MEDVDGAARLSQLTAEMAWLRRLARALLRNQDADDLAQDGWLVAIGRPPPDGRPLRPWLGRVLVNLARMQARARQRRDVRESKFADLVEPGTKPDDLVQRVELQQLVAGEVLGLAEPYRSTVLLHYFEELTCAEIARRLELPDGTVRRRLKVALDELRARIDAKDRTSRGGLAALAPLAGITAPSQPATPVALGVIAMKKVLAAAIVLILLILAGVLWTTRDKHAAALDAATDDHGSAGAAAAGGAFVPSARDEVPTWLTQLDVKPRRIAGRVTFRGAPVGGATVELASIASESGLVAAPRRATNVAGEFDFGPQRAMQWSVRASAPGKASATQDVDLRDPRAAPPPERIELELGACDAALVGTVRDASGGPIAKARIARLPNERGHGVPGGPAATSDDKGAYELCVETRWPGWVVVEVSADGYGAITFRTIVPGRIKIDFALVPEATIVGRVIRDDTGAPVPQAYVFVPAGPPDIESTPLRAAFTDTSGHFRIDRMAAGRHVVFARAEGMAEATHGTPVVVGVGQTSVEIELRLEVGSTIRGTVVDHGKPVAGARVTALDGVHGGATAVSQEAGTFVLAGVPRGEIRFSAQPYDVVSPQTFHVSQATHEGVTIEVESLGTIIGHVVRGKQPVPAANIDIRGPNDRELEPIRADAGGRFEARGLRPGPWTLFASDDREGAFGRAPETIQLARGQTAEVTIDLAYAASISGRVVDQTGNPVPGVTVIFRNTKSDDSGITATATDGTFRAATMTGGGQYRPGVRRSLLSSAPLRPASGGEFPLITLSDGNSLVSGVVLTVQLDHLSIAGKIVDSDGAPVSDARVVAQLVEGREGPRIERGFQDPADTTNVDGEFSIDDLLGGTYALRARSPAGVEATLSGIRAGRSDITLVLPSAGGIDVTTVGFRTAPQVTAILSGATGSSAPVVGVQQGNGFAIRNLSPGSYIVMARTPAEAASAVVEVTAGRTSRTTLTSAGSGVVAGRVREFRTGKPVEGMTCRALPRVGTEAAFAPGDGVRTDSRGAFLIAAAPAGPIAVSCDGLWRNYSDGLRLITLRSAERADLDIPVVAWSEEPGTTMGGLGAELDPRVLVPRLVRVQPGGPAAVAGLQEADVIITVDAASVTELSARGVYILIINRPPGTKVKLGVTRAGKTVTGEVTLGEAPQ